MQDLIDASAPDAVIAFLSHRHWLPAGAETIGIERAGEGNMNLVLRVRWREAGGAVGSAILKQARPWVEKYPDIPAPVGRLAVEADFYRLLSATPRLADAMPALLAVDEDAGAAWLEDLGDGGDHLGVYAGGSKGAGGDRLAQHDLDLLLRWLTDLHALDVDPAAWPRLANREMRALNHAHLFEIPLGAQPDGSDAPDVDAHCAGLQEVAAPLRRDAELRAAMRALGRVYLDDGPCLLHGDFYPGSWLASAAGPRVIDAEFGFLGRPEFDLGVLAAHLEFAGLDALSLDAYRPPGDFDPALARGFTGVELIRRLLGVAQLPLGADLARRQRWLEQGRAAVLSARS